MTEYGLLESETRKLIDEKLIAAGWAVQDKKRLNLHERLGVAVREMDTTTGPADYMLFIDGKACGILEAKREGTDLGGVAEQSARYTVSQSTPKVLAQEIVEQVEAALEEFRGVEEVLTVKGEAK